MADIFKTLKEQALKKTAGMPDENFTLRGLWKVDLAFKPNVEERTFRYSFLIAQTVGQGTCYCDKELSINDKLIGTDVRGILSERSCYDIAVLDAVYASIPRSPQRTYELRGNSIQKAGERNAIIVEEVERLLATMESGGGKPRGGRRLRIVNVGVLGNLLKALTDRGHSVLATDLDPSILGKSIHGVAVEDGSTKTLEYVKDCDLAVITGMTLTTDALNDIVELARANDTKIVMFAETGANFGEEYCRTVGIDVVVSEPFPFYIFQGVSTIEVYRR